MAQPNENFFGFTDTGKIRDNNEDAFIAQSILKGRYIIACVIDGVGGYEGGEIAAQIAKESILEHLQNNSGDLLSSMKQSLLIANEKIFSEKEKDDTKSQMACVLTLAVIDIVNNQFYYAHVGDTRLYLFRDKSLIKVTRDHSFVGFLEDSKRISEEEAMQHPKRNEINKALGFDPDISSVADYIETGISPFLPGDVLLLCSDGLSDMINSKRITSVLNSSQTIAQKTKTLIDEANNVGGKDNITVVLVQNNKKPLAQNATKPIVQKKNKGEKIEETIEDTSVTQVRKVNHSFTIFLFVLCILLAGGIVWLWNKNQEQEKLLHQQKTILSRSRNALEKKLTDNIQQHSFLFLNDSIYGKSILINDTLFIQKDSVHIKGNGTVFKNDSAYKGPALVVLPNCKYFLLEDVSLEGFDIGVIADIKTLHLKNVRFKNCRIPIQSSFYFPENDYVNSTSGDSILFRSDSLFKLK